MNQPELIRARELCQILQVSNSTLWRMRQRGELPKPIQLSKGIIAWEREVICNWLAERRKEAA
jgi:predicted DNA-binding transcriptional regulator AlpA